MSSIPFSGSEESGNTLDGFIRAVDTQYLSLNVKEIPSKDQINFIFGKLSKLENVELYLEQESFVGNIVKYIEIVITYISNFDVVELRKQKKYARSFLDVINTIFSSTRMKNQFIYHATTGIFNIFLYSPFNFVCKGFLLSLFNDIATDSERNVRDTVGNSLVDYIYKLVDSLYLFGDYVVQFNIIEILFRIFGPIIISEKLPYPLFPNDADLENLLKQVKMDFDQNARIWLNQFNKDSALIKSIACISIWFGDYECLTPGNTDVLWLDFNIKDKIVSFYCKSLDNDNWNRLDIISKFVSRVEIHRPVGKNETSLLMNLSKPCIAEMDQEFWDRASNNVKIILGNDLVSKLVTVAFPQMFGDSFLHASPRISKDFRSLYKPLKIKISKLGNLANIFNKSRSIADSSKTTERKVSLLPVRNVKSPISPTLTCLSPQSNKSSTCSYHGIKDIASVESSNIQISRCSGDSNSAIHKNNVHVSKHIESSEDIFETAQENFVSSQSESIIRKISKCLKLPSDSDDDFRDSGEGARHVQSSCEFDTQNVSNQNDGFSQMYSKLRMDNVSTEFENSENLLKRDKSIESTSRIDILEKLTQGNIIGNEKDLNLPFDESMIVTMKKLKHRLISVDKPDLPSVGRIMGAEADKENICSDQNKETLTKSPQISETLREVNLSGNLKETEEPHLYMSRNEVIKSSKLNDEPKISENIPSNFENNVQRLRKKYHKKVKQTKLDKKKLNQSQSDSQQTNEINPFVVFKEKRLFIHLEKIDFNKNACVGAIWRQTDTITESDTRGDTNEKEDTPDSKNKEQNAEVAKEIDADAKICSESEIGSVGLQQEDVPDFNNDGQSIINEETGNTHINPRGDTNEKEDTSYGNNKELDPEVAKEIDANAKICPESEIESVGLQQEDVLVVNNDGQSIINEETENFRESTPDTLDILEHHSKNIFKEGEIENVTDLKDGNVQSNSENLSDVEESLVFADLQNLDQLVITKPDKKLDIEVNPHALDENGIELMKVNENIPVENPKQNQDTFKIMKESDMTISKKSRKKIVKKSGEAIVNNQALRLRKRKQTENLKRKKQNTKLRKILNTRSLESDGLLTSDEFSEKTVKIKNQQQQKTPDLSRETSSDSIEDDVSLICYQEKNKNKLNYDEYKIQLSKEFDKIINENNQNEKKQTALAQDNDLKANEDNRLQYDKNEIHQNADAVKQNKIADKDENIEKTSLDKRKKIKNPDDEIVPFDIYIGNTKPSSRRRILNRTPVDTTVTKIITKSLALVTTAAQVHVDANEQVEIYSKDVQKERVQLDAMDKQEDCNRNIKDVVHIDPVELEVENITQKSSVDSIETSQEALKEATNKIALKGQKKSNVPIYVEGKENVKETDLFDTIKNDQIKPPEAKGRKLFDPVSYERDFLEGIIKATDMKRRTKKAKAKKDTSLSFSKWEGLLHNASALNLDSTVKDKTARKIQKGKSSSSEYEWPELDLEGLDGKIIPAAKEKQKTNVDRKESTVHNSTHIKDIVMEDLEISEISINTTTDRIGISESLKKMDEIYKKSFETYDGGKRQYKKNLRANNTSFNSLNKIKNLSKETKNTSNRNRKLINESVFNYSTKENLIEYCKAIDDQSRSATECRKRIGDDTLTEFMPNKKFKKTNTDEIRTEICDITGPEMDNRVDNIEPDLRTPSLEKTGIKRNGLNNIVILQDIRLKPPNQNRNGHNVVNTCILSDPEKMDIGRTITVLLSKWIEDALTSEEMQKLKLFERK